MCWPTRTTSRNDGNGSDRPHTGCRPPAGMNRRSRRLRSPARMRRMSTLPWLGTTSYVIAPTLRALRGTYVAHVTFPCQRNPAPAPLDRSAHGHNPARRPAAPGRTMPEGCPGTSPHSHCAGKTSRSDRTARRAVHGQVSCLPPSPVRQPPTRPPSPARRLRSPTPRIPRPWVRHNGTAPHDFIGSVCRKTSERARLATRTLPDPSGVLGNGVRIGAENAMAAGSRRRSAGRHPYAHGKRHVRHPGRLPGRGGVSHTGGDRVSGMLPAGCRRHPADRTDDGTVRAVAAPCGPDRRLRRALEGHGPGVTAPARHRRPGGRQCRLQCSRGAGTTRSTSG